MGSAHDIMQTFTNKEIREHFKGCDGWVCQQVPSPYIHDLTYVISREVRAKKEIIALAVTYNEDPSTLSLEALTVSLDRKSLKGQYLLVPRAANVSGLPGPVQIIYMKSFGFVEGKLVWLTKKKNAKHYAQPEEPEPVRVESSAVACEPHAA